MVHTLGPAPCPGRVRCSLTLPWRGFHEAHDGKGEAQSSVLSSEAGACSSDRFDPLLCVCRDVYLG